jgi:hypothetical protein
MPTDEELLAIKERAAAQLMRLPGVNGVGIGGRVRGGERINELVLKVYVTTKRPPQEVEPAELIPAQFEGVPTDVAELPPEIKLVQAPAPTGRAWVPPSEIDLSRKRPLIGGTCLQVDMPDASEGTLGCMLRAGGDPAKVYALTNWHILQGSQGVSPNFTDIPPKVGTTTAGQPYAGGSITKCCSALIGKVAGGGYAKICDAGLVKLDPGTVWLAHILEIGPVNGRHKMASIKEALHLPVRKRGIRSGLTGGTIESVSTHRHNENGEDWTNVIVVQPNPVPASAGPVFFLEQGDSGSALVTEKNEVVGLMFAIPRSTTHPEPDYDGPEGYRGLVSGYGFPIDDVLGSFTTVAGLDVVEAREAEEPYVVPGAAMVALAPELAPTLLGRRAPTPVPAAAPIRVPGTAPIRVPGTAPIRVPGTAPIRVPVTGIGSAPPPAAALAGLERELDRSERGRALVMLWLTHQAELLGLVNSNRRVATVWHRSGASALFQVFLRMLAQPDLELPRTLNGDPLSVCIERVCVSMERFASPALRADLASVRAELPELGGHSLRGVFSVLGAT